MRDVSGCAIVECEDDDVAFVAWWWWKRQSLTFGLGEFRFTAIEFFV